MGERKRKIKERERGVGRREEEKNKEGKREEGRGGIFYTEVYNETTVAVVVTLTTEYLTTLTPAAAISSIRASESVSSKFLSTL